MGEYEKEILEELKNINKTLKKTAEDTNYQLRRMATRIEEIQK